MWEQLGMGWVGLSGGLCPSLLFAPTRKADVGAWMWLHLQRFQEELAQLRAAPSSAIPVPARAVLTVPVGSARSSPSHPVLEESSVMPPWNCASPQAPSLPCAHPGTSGWAGMWVPAVPGGGDRIDLCSRHSSADSFGISRWEDKREQPRVSRGLCHTWQVHLALQGLFPPSSLPFFLPSCCFSLPPEQTGRSLPNLVNELGDKPCSLITGDRWPGEIPGGCSPARGSSQGAAAHRLCSSTPQGPAAALPNLSGMWLDPWWDHSPHGGTACWLWALFPVWNPQHLPIILPVLTQQFCVFSWEKKKTKNIFSLLFFPGCVNVGAAQGLWQHPCLAQGHSSLCRSSQHHRAGVQHRWWGSSTPFLGGWRLWGAGRNRAGSSSTIFVPLSGTVFSLSAPACFLCWGLIHTR